MSGGSAGGDEGTEGGWRWPRIGKQPLRVLLVASGLAAAAVLFGWSGLCAQGCTPAIQRWAAQAARSEPLARAILIGAAAAFAAAEALLVLATIRLYRRQPEAAVPSRLRTEVAWTIAPAVILAVLFGFAWRVAARGPLAPGDVIRVQAIGHPWWWEFRYPDLSIVTAHELVVPVTASVEVTVETTGEPHGFWAPELFGKRTAQPGQPAQVSFRPAEAGAGLYAGQCVEKCADLETQMHFVVDVRPEADFRAWVERQQAAVIGPQTEGQAAFLGGACAGCHTVQGTSAAGERGPDLTHLMSRRYLAGGLVPNTAENLRRWLLDPHTVKAGAGMQLDAPLEEGAAELLVAYLLTLE